MRSSPLHKQFTARPFSHQQPNMPTKSRFDSLLYGDIHYIKCLSGDIKSPIGNISRLPIELTATIVNIRLARIFEPLLEMDEYFHVKAIDLREYYLGVFVLIEAFPELLSEITRVVVQHQNYVESKVKPIEEAHLSHRSYRYRLGLPPGRCCDGRRCERFRKEIGYWEETSDRMKCLLVEVSEGHYRGGGH